MKKVFIIVFAAAFILPFALKPFALSLLEQQLKSAVSPAKLSIKNKDLGFGYLSMSNVVLEQPRQYRFSVDSITVRFTAVSLLNQEITGITVKQFSGKGPNFAVESGQLHVGPNGRETLSVVKLQYNQLVLRQLTARPALVGKTLLLSDIAFQSLGGKGSGQARVSFDQSYKADFLFNNLSLAAVVNDFKLKEKVDMTGILNGRISIAGKGQKMEILDGGFSTDGQEGSLAVKDTKFLENIAKNTNQPANIIVDSLKDYRYNVGLMKLFLKDSGLNIDTEFNGPQGKRALSVTVHDVILK